jgi:DmsE family decaheme c-type cytochrome
MGLLLTFSLSVCLQPAQGQKKEQAQKKEKLSKKPPESKSPPYSRDLNPEHYAGTETCETCHAEVVKQVATTPHYKTRLDTRRGPAWQGCEGCHGPGKEHAESADPSKIFSFKQASAASISQRCLDCHQYSSEHANFGRSAHNVNDVSCVSCHSPHHAKEKQFLLTAAQPALCYGCHQEARLDFMKPFRHRVESNLVQCTDCHNQHGGFLTSQLRTTSAQDAVCFRCHSEKAGPFVFEHAPVKTEGCVACHTPHGSQNPRLLKRSQVNQLCLECHTFTVDSVAPAAPSFHNQAQKYQACTMCHTSIHGSNNSSVFFK